MDRRARMVQQIAGLVPSPVGDGCVRVGIDGPDGAGKTVFADELAGALRQLGRTVIRVGVDDFHRPRSDRYRRGRDSPEGFFFDSFDYERLWSDVLVPLGPGGSRRYRPASHDLRTDEVLDLPWQVAPPGAVVVVDGLFLHRDELAGAWELSVLLVVPPTITAARMAARDGSAADPEHPGLRRYLQAQRIYADQCRPRERADLVVDNSDLRAPVLVERQR